MLINDSVDVVGLDVSIPNTFGIHDEDRPLVVLLVAAHPGGADMSKFFIFDAIPQMLEQAFGALPPAMVSSYRRADKHVQRFSLGGFHLAILR